MKFERVNRNDPRLTDLLKITAELSPQDDEANHIILATNDQDTCLVICEVDQEQRISRLKKFFLVTHRSDREPRVLAAIDGILNYVHALRPLIDVLYTTTRNTSLLDQQYFCQRGFKVLGIFPNIRGGDQSYLNGLAAFYFPEVLKDYRVSPMKIHPLIKPFQRLALGELGIETFSAEGEVTPSILERSLLQPQTLTLESIQASQFVLSQFKNLKRTAAQSDNFYPFQFPNTMLTNPDGSIQIFAVTNKESGFGALVGEKVEIGVDPVQLLKDAAKILRSLGAEYLEVINEASDLDGIEALFQAGFRPTAYFPALKKSGAKRRDYVIMSLSGQTICVPDEKTPAIYRNYYQEFLNSQSFSVTE